MQNSNSVVCAMLIAAGIFGTASSAHAQRIGGGEIERSGGNVGSRTDGRGGDDRVKAKVTQQAGRIAAAAIIGALLGEKVGRVVAGGVAGALAGVFLTPTETAPAELDENPEFRAWAAKMAEKRRQDQVEQRQSTEINERERRGGPGSIGHATRPGSGTRNDAPAGPRARASTKV